MVKLFFWGGGRQAERNGIVRCFDSPYPCLLLPIGYSQSGFPNFLFLNLKMLLALRCLGYSPSNWMQLPKVYGCYLPNVPGISGQEAVCLGTCASVPGECRTGALQLPVVIHIILYYVYGFLWHMVVYSYMWLHMALFWYLRSHIW